MIISPKMQSTIANIFSGAGNGRMEGKIQMDINYSQLADLHASRKFHSNFLGLIIFILFCNCEFLYAVEFDGWRVMPVRSIEEFQQGKIGGEAEQHNQGIARSRSNPNVIYLAHDCGQIWRSDNGGETWNKPLGKGLHVFSGLSVEVDPANPKIVFALMDETWSWMHKDYQGLYRSKDGGDNWEFVLSAVAKNNRRYEHNIAYDLTSVSNARSNRWYAAFHNDFLYFSEDGGDTWKKMSDLKKYGTIHSIHVHPSDGKSVYLATKTGLFVSNSRGENIVPLGNLPAGEISSLAIVEKNPSILYAVVRGDGLYISKNSGETFTKLHNFKLALYIFVNQGFPKVLYLIGESSYSLVSSDGGNQWTKTKNKPAPGLWRDTFLSGWKGNISGGLTGVSPNPTKAQEAVVFSRATIWKTSNGGILFNDGSTLFTGYACGIWNDNISFDYSNPNRFATFNADVGMAITGTRGDYFYRRGVPLDWRPAKLPWTSMGGGDLQPGTETVVAAVGDVWSKKLVRSTNSGREWQIVDNEVRNYLFVAFHLQETNIVYTDNKISYDSGVTFSNIDALAPYKASILGMCRAHPDVVYAMAKPRKKILRSSDKGKSWKVYADVTWTFGIHDSKPTFAVHPSDTSIVYTIDKKGDLAIFNGKVWRSLGVLERAGSRNPRNYVRSVIVDPNHPEILYAGMHASGIDNVWRSTNNGVTWESISFNLPRTTIQALFVNPHSGELFISNCYGTWVFPPPYKSENRIYGKLHSRPSCNDGIKNGDETGIDCGGTCRDCAGNTLPGIDKNKKPIKFNLLPSYQNPFNTKQSINFEFSQKSNIKVNVYCSGGELVASLLNSELHPGRHSVIWDGMNQKGRPAASGLYFYRLLREDESYVNKMILMR